MKQPARLSIVGVLLAIVAAFFSLDQAGKKDTTSASGTRQSEAPLTSEPAAPSKVGFTSRRSWQDHFEKHGHEFGARTADEYLARAQALRDAPRGAHILEATRQADGVICRFDRKTGAFLAYHADQTIRTFFRPNDGEAYYERQLDRLPRQDR